MRIILFFLLIVLQSLDLISQQNNKLTYLSNNKVGFNLDSGISIKNSLGNQGVYFTGEYHCSKSNDILSLQLFKELYYKCNVRCFIFEYSVSDVKFINDYIQNGGEEKLDQISINRSGNVDFLNEEKEFYFKLKKFNDGLPINEKIKLYGIDVIQDKYYAITELRNLLPQNYSNNNEDLNLLLFFDNGKYSQKTAIRILEEMNTRIKEDSITYKSIIGANFSEFKFILKGCLIGLKIGNKVSAEGLEEREQYIYQNLRKIINENPNVSFYIKAGRAHVSITTQKRWLHLKDWKSVAARLNTNFDSPVIGKVCSVVFYYSNNLRYEENHRIEPIIKKEDIPLFLQYSTTPLTLFKLDGENTPFKEMAEKFQYLIIDKY